MVFSKPLFVLCDHKLIPRLNRNNYVHFHIHDITPVNGKPFVLSSKSPYVLEEIKEKNKIAAYVAEIQVDDLVFYTTSTSHSVKIVDEVYCDIVTKKEVCRLIEL